MQRSAVKLSIELLANILVTEDSKRKKGKFAILRSHAWWEVIAQLLKNEDYIENFFIEENQKSFPSGIKPKGLKFIEYMTCKNEPLSVWRTVTPAMCRIFMRLHSFNDNLLKRTNVLYDTLSLKRSELAKICQCASSTIASNEALEEMAVAKPKYLINLDKLKLHGLSKMKVNVFAEEFLRVINKYMFKQKPSLQNILSVYPLRKRQSDSLWSVIYKMLLSGMSVKEMARRKETTEQLVWESLAIAIEHGCEIKLSMFKITESMKEKVAELLFQNDVIFLSTIPQWSAADDLRVFGELSMETEQILLTWTYLEVRMHICNLNVMVEHDFDPMLNFAALYSEYRKANKQNVVRKHGINIERPSLSEALSKYPLPIEIPHPSWSLLCLICAKVGNVNAVAQHNDLQPTILWDSLATGIRCGYKIKLSTFGITEEMKTKVAKTFLTPRNTEFLSNIPNYESTKELTRNEDTAQKLLLIWSYLQVRVHLFFKKAMYCDFEPMDGLATFIKPLKPPRSNEVEPVRKSGRIKERNQVLKMIETAMMAAGDNGQGFIL